MLRSGSLSSLGYEVDKVNTYASSLLKFYLYQEGFPQEQQYTAVKHKNQENSPLFWCCLGNILRFLVCNVILWNIMQVCSGNQFESYLAIWIQRNPNYVHFSYHMPFKLKGSNVNEAVPPFKTSGVKDTLHYSGCQLPGALVYLTLSSWWVFWSGLSL